MCIVWHILAGLAGLLTGAVLHGAIKAARFEIPFSRSLRSAGLLTSSAPITNSFVSLAASLLFSAAAAGAALVWFRSYAVAYLAVLAAVAVRSLPHTGHSGGNAVEFLEANREHVDPERYEETRQLHYNTIRFR